MRELWMQVKQWLEADKAVALATVVDVSGSSLRPMGSKMAMTNQEEIIGSVSGGCVEAAVYEEAQQVLRSGKPRLLKYGVSNENAWSVGLVCGGSIQVFVEKLPKRVSEGAPDALRMFDLLDEALSHNRLAAQVTVLDGEQIGRRMLVWADGSFDGSLGAMTVDQTAVRLVQAQFESQDGCRAVLDTAEGLINVFIDVFAPPARLIVIGAVHIAIPLVALAKTMGFHTVVVDARAAFATRERFPHADELIVNWPAEALQKLELDESCYLAVLSHDEKFDNPALQVALASRARYIGVLGSRKTHEKRLQSLREMDVPPEQFRRIHAPIGLDLGSIQPEEIALSILAEMVAVRHGGGGAAEHTA